MKIKITTLIALFITLSITGCAHIDISKKNVTDNKPANSKVQFGTVSKDVFKALGTNGDRALIGTIGKNGNLSFYGQNGNKFRFTKRKSKHKGKGKLKNTITIKFYQNSPECFLIEPGDGTSFWYPWDCPK